MSGLPEKSHYFLSPPGKPPPPWYYGTDLLMSMAKNCPTEYFEMLWNADILGKKLEILLDLTANLASGPAYIYMFVSSSV